MRTSLRYLVAYRQERQLKEMKKAAIVDLTLLLQKSIEKVKRDARKDP